MIKEIRYTLKSTCHWTTVQVATWVKEKMPSYTAQGALMVARSLMREESWQPPYPLIENPLEAGPCNFEVTNFAETELDEYEVEQDRLWELQRLGATGNEQAAIAFCQAIRDGRVNLYSAAYA